MTQREWADKDYYADLGVSKDASDQEIKKAYRKLARENHPDAKPGDKAAEERFKRASEAHSVLGDETKRAEYDEFKRIMASGGFHPGGFGGGGGGFHPGGFSSDFDVSDLFSRTGGGGGAFGDIFGNLFDRGSAGPSRSRRGQDVETEITLDFREAAQGVTVPIRLTNQAPCVDCHGSGAKPGTSPTTCSQCNGSGLESEQRGTFGLSRPCTQCSGTGSYIADPCSTCRGSGSAMRTRQISVRVPVGVVDGQKVRLAGQGEAGLRGAPAGDLYVTVHVRPDPLFDRKGDNLLVTVPVSFTEAALGSTISVPTLDKPVKVKLPQGTANGRTLRVRGSGVPKRGGGAGDLLITVDVQVPATLTPEMTEALEQYRRAAEAAGDDPRRQWAGAR